MLRSLILPVLLLCLALQAAPVFVEQKLHARVRMRDGVKLCANVFRPAVAGRAPAILIRTPYGKGTQLNANWKVFVEHGYAVVIEDVRGRYHSQGYFSPLDQESNDGDDTLNWIAEQPWSNGKVGMLGGSYSGIAQWKAAATNNPYLKAIFPVVSGCDDYLDRFYSPGGALKLGHRLLWLSENLRAPDFFKPEFHKFIYHLPLRTADRAATGQRIEMYQKALDHPAVDGFWKSISVRYQLAKVRVPVFAAGGWYDNFVGSDLDAFMGLRKLGRANRLIVGPWPHNMSQRFPDVDFGQESMVPLRTLQLAWFDFWLKGDRTKMPSGPPLRIFVMGANRWREEYEWPLPRTRWTPLYLASKGSANTLYGDGLLRAKPPRGGSSDRFVYDPRKPVPTRGGAVCCNPKVFPWGPFDQREIEKRRDVLVYTGPVIREDLEVTGPVRVVLYVTTSAPDTDFTAKLVDVFPDGHARNLTDGILRLRYRNSIEKPELARPGGIHEVTIDAGVTSNVFRAGHRIRLEISSSNFPRFDRNPNTGRPLAEETELLPALQTIHHTRKYPSHVVLPVIP